jgi:hypothetical protein
MPAFPGWERRKVYGNNKLAESVLNFDVTIATNPPREQWNLGTELCLVSTSLLARTPAPPFNA